MTILDYNTGMSDEQRKNVCNTLAYDLLQVLRSDSDTHITSINHRIRINSYQVADLLNQYGVIVRVNELVSAQDIYNLF